MGFSGLFHLVDIWRSVGGVARGANLGSRISPGLGNGYRTYINLLRRYIKNSPKESSIRSFERDPPAPRLDPRLGLLSDRV